MTNQSKVIIGNRLREMRLNKGETQGEIAAILDVSKAAVCQYELGQAVPRDGVKEKYAKHFGRTVQFIFFRQQ